MTMYMMLLTYSFQTLGNNMTDTKQKIATEYMKSKVILIIIIMIMTLKHANWFKNQLGKIVQLVWAAGAREWEKSEINEIIIIKK